MKKKIIYIVLAIVVTAGAVLGILKLRDIQQKQQLALIQQQAEQKESDASANADVQQEQEDKNSENTSEKKEEPVHNIKVAADYLGVSFALSPDGKKIAYSGRNAEDNMAEIWISDINENYETSNAYIVDRCTVNLDNKGYWNITWLPDNSGLIFFTDKNYVTEVMKYNIGTKKVSIVYKTENNSAISNVSFGAKSGSMYYVKDSATEENVFSEFRKDTSDFKNGQKIYRIGISTKKKVHATPMMDISPDEKKIVYSSYNRMTGKYNIWLYDIETKQESMISNISYHSVTPEWSPDGKYIAYAEQEDDKSEFYLNIYNVESKETTKIAEPEAHTNIPSWSPDGKTLMYLYNSNTVLEIRYRQFSAS